MRIIWCIVPLIAAHSGLVAASVDIVAEVSQDRNMHSKALKESEESTDPTKIRRYYGRFDGNDGQKDIQEMSLTADVSTKDVREIKRSFRAVFNHWLSNQRNTRKLGKIKQASKGNGIWKKFQWVST